MDLEQARERLSSDLGNDSDRDVALTSDEIERLLEEALVPDVAGRAPGATGYVQTWDHNLAAAEGWRLKASRVATTSTTTGYDGERTSDDFRYLNAVRQAEYYDARRRPPRLA